ncbi:hypothetical protein ATANTOWER_005027 [Ataeniobius toweri]|uniref:PH domain-containing protein n=1 Tax=Ataeniobius toweri TaxID=208326 RepID=A0ABU7BXG7_9TELE|nr:hypothetical protein [Ataeniobius toweri]
MKAINIFATKNVPFTGRWFIREGWLKIVPPKGSEAKPKMFFLFSDLLLQAKCCSPLSLSNGEKFVGQHAYPLQDAAVEKVFGHTRGHGGLLSLTFPKVKILLMSSNHDDLNDWYQCLSSAISSGWQSGSSTRMRVLSCILYISKVY